MGNLTGPEGQQAGVPVDQRPRSHSTNTAPHRRTQAASAAHRTTAASLGRVAASQVSSQTLEAPEPSEPSEPATHLLQPPSPRATRTVPPPSPRVEVHSTHKAPPTIEDFRAPTMAHIQTSPREPAPQPPVSSPRTEQPLEQAPPPPHEQPAPSPSSSSSSSSLAVTEAPSYPAPAPPVTENASEQAESEDIWKLAASLGAADDQASTEASGLELLDALAELRDNFGEADDDDEATKNALAEIQAAASDLPLVTEELLNRPASRAETRSDEDAAASSSSSPPESEPTQELLSALEDLSAAVDESTEATENLMAVLSGISDSATAPADESTDAADDLTAALSELSAVEAASQPDNDNTTTTTNDDDDIFSVATTAAAAQEEVEESTEDLMAALALLNDVAQPADDDSATTGNATDDLMAALAGLGEPADETTSTADLMRSLGELSASAGDVGDEVEAVESVEDLMASLQAVEASTSEHTIEGIADDATTDDLMASLDALSNAAGDSPALTTSSSTELPLSSKKVKTMKGLLSLKQDTFLSTTWETSDGSAPAVEIPEEFAAAFAKHAENKGRKKVDVGRIGRGGRGRTKKANKPDPTQFAPMTSIEDSQWMISPSAPPVLKQAAPPAKTNNPAWMQSLFGGPDVAAPPEEEEELAPLDVDDTVPQGLAAASAASPSNSLVRDWSLKEDINRPGLRRSKKRPIKGNKHGKRPLQMEDFNFCSFPWLGDVSQGMFCVFDGHVDKDCGQALVTAWPMTWKKVTTGLNMTEVTDLTDIFKKAFLAVDEEMRQYEYCGATMTVVLIWEGPNKQRYLQAANVGDSLAFLCRTKTAVDLSEVHCVREPTEAQRLRDAGSTVNDGATRINGLSVSRAIGDHFVKEVTPGFTAEPFVSPSIALGPEDTHMVVASDGLWDVITGQQAVDEVQKHTSAVRMSSALLQTALASKKCNDNVTVCAIVL